MKGIEIKNQNKRQQFIDRVSLQRVSYNALKQLAYKILKQKVCKLATKCRVIIMQNLSNKKALTAHTCPVAWGSAKRLDHFSAFKTEGDWFINSQKISQISTPKSAKFKFKFIYSHLFNYNTTIRKKKEEVKNRAKYTLN